MKFRNPYQKHGLIILLILGLYLISTRVFNIQIQTSLTLIKIIIVVSLSVVVISLGKFMYFNSSGKYLFLKRKTVVAGCILFVAFLSYFILYYPVARDLKYCTSDLLTKLESVSENLNKEKWDVQTQCQYIKPLVVSFDKCVDTVREMNGGLVTEIVFKLTSSLSGADGRFKKIETACSPF